jgi:hypothetical protein
MRIPCRTVANAMLRSFQTGGAQRGKDQRPMFRSSNPHKDQSPASRTKMMRVRTVLLFGLWLATVAAAADFPLPPCESPQAVRDFLMAQPSEDANVPYAQRQDRSGRAPRYAMLEKYPRDLALHQARRMQLIGPMYRTWKAPIAEYRALMEKHPGDPLYQVPVRQDDLRHGYARGAPDPRV